jgi:hypothetical protein
VRPVKNEMILYRFQDVDNENFEQVLSNQDGLLSWKSFMFASSNKINVENFNQRLDTNSKRQSVLFIIAISLANLNVFNHVHLSYWSIVQTK